VAIEDAWPEMMRMVMGMNNVPNAMRILAVLLGIICYISALWLGLTEETRRSLSIVEPRPQSDFVQMDIRVTGVDTVNGILSARIRLIPNGRYALDKNTPAVDLKLLLNSMSGKQAVTFEKGVRIVPIDCTILLSGNPNKYPLDVYTTHLDLLVTTPGKSQTPLPPASIGFDDMKSIQGSLIIGADDLTHSETVIVVETVSASIPGFKFRGTLTREGNHQLNMTNFTLSRAYNVIGTSVVVMTTMLGLAISIMGMVLRVTASPGEVNLLPLSLCIALIFGLPALRGMQPGVPGVGVLSDYLSYIWASFIVSTSAIALAWTWIIRSRKQDRAARPVDHTPKPQ
jgi:hypothetical protein